ncbi:uncharacterized protein [Antedon mediterranea]|uniref:uncharacterized protein n=1 Tax=Antedon mediterranea TaxID=105859 RepID=UPI003AF5E02B
MDMPNGPVHKSRTRRRVHKSGTRRRHEPNNRERSLELPSSFRRPKQVPVNSTNDSDAGTIRNSLENARSEIQRFTDLMSDYVDLADRRVKNVQEPPAGAFPGGTIDEKIQYYENRRRMYAHAYEMSLKSRKLDENAKKNLQIFPDDDFRERYFRRKEIRMKMKHEAEEEFAQLCEYIVEIRQRKFNRANSIADVQEVGNSRQNDESQALLTRRQLVGSEHRNRVMNHSAGDGATNQHQGDVMAHRDETTTPAIDGDNATVGMSNQQESTIAQPRRRRWRIRVPWLRRIWRWARKHRRRNSRTISDAAPDNQ